LAALEISQLDMLELLVHGAFMIILIAACFVAMVYLRH
jgi:hypothetical protein